MKKIPISLGDRFGRLTVVALEGTSNWQCICDCGNKRVVAHRSLVTGNTRSCGCLHREQVSNLNKTHGESKSREYSIWHGMMLRCYYPSQPHYKHYGERGIVVCKRWHKFENFLKDMGRCPQGYELDRRENSKGYSLKNYRWITKEVNRRNVRLRKDNKIGVPGITWLANGKWKVRIGGRRQSNNCRHLSK